MAFVIPTIFTAVNGMGGEMVQIGNQMNGLAMKAERASLAMNGLIPSMGGIGKTMGGMLKMGAAAGVIAAVGLSGKAIIDYQTEISNLSAVTGATGAQLEKFKTQIEAVANDKSVKRSMVEVAQAFTAVDNNMPELHQFPEQLGEVTKQVIILAKAGRMELGPAAEAMTMTMNQFGAGAKDAAHMIDVMAAGAVYGSSRISETAEALQKFGAVAKNTLGITFEESVALVELGSKFEKGAEGGTRLRNILLQIAVIKTHPEMVSQFEAMGVNMDKLTSNTVGLSDKLKELSKIAGNKELMALFGEKRNVAMLSGLFSRIDQLPKIEAGLTEVGRAAEMAEINTDNIAGSAQKLVAAWVNQIILGKQLNAGMSLINGTLKAITNNLGWLTSVTAYLVEGFLAWKAILFLTTKSAVVYNFAMGMMAVVSKSVHANIAITTASMAGFNAATKLASLGVMGIAGWAGIAIGAIALIGNQMSYAAQKASFLRHEIKLTKDGFEELEQPISQATLSLRDYQNQVAKHYRDVNEASAQMYMMKNHTLQYLFSLDNLKNSLNPSGSGLPSITPLPNKADFPEAGKSALDSIATKPTASADDGMSENNKLLKQIADTLSNRPGGLGRASINRKQTGSFA